MAAPQSEIAICNMALSLLKQDPIMNIVAPSSKQEVLCSQWYDATRREVLRKHPWNFASKRIQLTPSSDTPAFGYASAYNLPNDFVRVLTIGDEVLGEITFEYQLENYQLLLNNDGATLNLRYVYDFTNVARFDALFTKVLVLQLAINMGPKLSISPAALTALKALLDDDMPKATSVDGQERPPTIVDRKPILKRRRAGSQGAGKWTVFD